MQKGTKPDFYLMGLLLVVALVGLVFMPREEYSGDPRAIRSEVVSFLNTGSLNVPVDIVRQFRGERGQYFDENPATLHWCSNHGIFNDVMYVPPLAIEKICNGGKLEYLPDKDAHLRRILILNLYNVLISIGIAWYLYAIARRYTESPVTAILFVVTSLYCTYWWYYLRAQTSEIYQTLFMLGFYHHMTGFFRSDGKKPGSDQNDFFLAGLFLGFLILVKVFFLVLIPACLLTFLFLVFRQDREVPLFKRIASLSSLLIWMIVPLALALGTLLWVNYYKFGSPLESGYGQWQDRGQPIFSGTFFGGIKALFFDIHGCVFLFFPPLALALIGYGRFLRRWPVEGFLILVASIIIFALNPKMLNVLGSWGYGPRYVVTVLPLLSLPFIQTLSLVGENWNKWPIKGLVAAMILFFATSLREQLNVNALPFFVYFDMQSLMAPLNDPAIDRYFDDRSFGAVNRDILAYKHGKPWQPVEMMKRHLLPWQQLRVENYIRSETFSNYYWWP